MPSFAGACGVVEAAIQSRVFPAASVEIGRAEGAPWRRAFGRFTWEPDAAPVSAATIFDLASLTKVLVTTTLMMDLVSRQSLRVEDFVRGALPEWSGDDRAAVTIQDLLEHASGLPARLFDQPPKGRREFEHEICAMPLEYTPRTGSVYSDLGFILLGFAASDRGRGTLDQQFEEVWRRLQANDRSLQGETLGFNLTGDRRTQAAPTWPLAQDARRGRVLRGDVHDDYAARLGGVAGHSGLFGTAGAVGGFARTLLRARLGDETLPAPFSPARIRRFVTKSSVPGSSRALGWDTMRQTSSCGTRMSAEAFGHVGFTGTSLWIDPMSQVYAVLLSNRAFANRVDDRMQTVRRAFHDAVMDELPSSPL